MSKRQQVLIVEDERQIRESLSDFFNLQGYDVLAAASGDEGLATGLAEEPDLILLDIMLPGMHGFDVCRGLREGGYSGPVLFLSAKGEQLDSRSDLFSLGIILYEMITGQVPYESDTALGTLLKRTQEAAPPPVKCEPGVPKYLNDIAVRCMQIDRELRYSSAREIIDDLDARQATRTMMSRRSSPSK